MLRNLIMKSRDSQILRGGNVKRFFVINVISHCHHSILIRLLPSLNILPELCFLENGVHSCEAELSIIHHLPKFVETVHRRWSRFDNEMYFGIHLLQVPEMLLREWREIIGDDVDTFCFAIVEDADKAVYHCLTIHFHQRLRCFHTLL